MTESKMSQPELLRESRGCIERTLGSASAPSKPASASMGPRHDRNAPARGPGPYASRQDCAVGEAPGTKMMGTTCLLFASRARHLHAVADPEHGGETCAKAQAQSFACWFDSFRRNQSVQLIGLFRYLLALGVADFLQQLAEVLDAQPYLVGKRPEFDAARLWPFFNKTTASRVDDMSDPPRKLLDHRNEARVRHRVEERLGRE